MQRLEATSPGLAQLPYVPCHYRVSPGWFSMGFGNISIVVVQVLECADILKKAILSFDSA